MEVGPEGRHPAGRATVGPQPAGLHIHSGGGAETGEKLQVDLLSPPPTNPTTVP